jgi:hypothetical protein
MGDLRIHDDRPFMVLLGLKWSVDAPDGQQRHIQQRSFVDQLTIL